MKIDIDKDYVSQFRIENGIATEQPFKVCVDRYCGRDISPLMDEIERTFKVYQYVKNNGVEYGKHELFFWTNTDPNCMSCFDGKMTFFTLNLNDRTPIDERKAVLDRLLKIIGAWDGTAMEVGKKDSQAHVCYCDEKISADEIHKKALERIAEIGERKCECGGMIGRFRHDARGVIFQKYHTRKFYIVSDESAACARLVA